jgi:hypothetical protein
MPRENDDPGRHRGDDRDPEGTRGEGYGDEGRERGGHDPDMSASEPRDTDRGDHDTGGSGARPDRDGRSSSWDDADMRAGYR